jgi:hypothetical protein
MNKSELGGPEDTCRGRVLTISLEDSSVEPVDLEHPAFPLSNALRFLDLCWMVLLMIIGREIKSFHGFYSVHAGIATESEVSQLDRVRVLI